jgi:membrane protein
MRGIEDVIRQISPVAAPVVIKEVNLLAQHRAWGWISILILFWSVTPLATALRSAFSDIFKTRSPRPFWSTKFFDIVSVLVLVSLLILLTLGKVYGPAIAGKLKDLPALARAAQAAGSAILALGALGIFYYLLLPVRPRTVQWLTGAAITLLLLALVGPALGLLLRINPNYGYAFGSLKMVFLLFVWVYYSFAVILFGAEVMANLRRKDALVLKRLLLNPAKTFKPGALLNRFVRTFGEHEVICREGDPGNEMFFILAGEVALSKQGRPLLTMRAGDYFGEMAMLLNTPRTATAAAAAPETALAVISRQNFEIVLSENPGIVLKMLQELASRLKITTEKTGLVIEPVQKSEK